MPNKAAETVPELLTPPAKVESVTDPPTAVPPT
jgi:hypothetical protein